MAQFTLNYAIKRFQAAWHSSAEDRMRAARVYTRAVDEFDLNARQAFHELVDFQNWTAMQWRLLYHIGAGNIAPEYMDFARPSLPLSMQRRGLPVGLQQDIFDNGLVMTDITGKQRIVKLRYLLDKHLAQVFDDKGRRRSVLNQIKWMQDHQKPNCEVLADGRVRIRHACILTSAMVKRLADASQAAAKKASK